MTYSSFPRRFGAHFLDVVVVGLIIFLIGLFGSHYKSIAIASNLLQGFIFFLYMLYYHAKCGQTPGKRWMGIKVVRSNGSKIDLHHSIYRSIFLFFGSMPWMVSTMIAMSLIDADQFAVLGHHEFQQLENSLRPYWYKPLSTVTGFVFLADLIVMLSTKKKQSLHDILGDTVVVHALK